MNAISERELRDKKVEYKEETDIKHFPYHDWIRFIKYNCKDSLLQMGIERKTNDLMGFYMRSMSNQTPYNKIFRETHLLRNVREKYFEEQGWVQSNNINIIGDPTEDEDFTKIEGTVYDEEDEEKSFKGAINAEPTMNDYVGDPILGIKSNNLFRNSVDFDMGAFYPSIKIISNMDAITLLYKASFNNNEFMSGQFHNRSLNQDYEEKDKFGKTRKLDITGEAVNTYVSKNILTMAYNYLSMPNLAEIEKAITKIMEG